jgi:hypothetical protein
MGANIFRQDFFANFQVRDFMISLPVPDSRSPSSPPLLTFTYSFGNAITAI